MYGTDGPSESSWVLGVVLSQTKVDAKPNITRQLVNQAIYTARFTTSSMLKQRWACWLPKFVIRDDTVNLSESSCDLGVLLGLPEVDMKTNITRQ